MFYPWSYSYKVILLLTFQSKGLLFLFLALVRTSSIILNRRENEHSCIIPGLREKSFIKYDVSCEFFMGTLYVKGARS